jgi:hypothetical protein
MKLSDAIEAGVRLAAQRGVRQGRDSYFDVAPDGGLCACAMGLAFLGAGLLTPEKASAIVEAVKAGVYLEGEYEERVTDAVNETLAGMPEEWTAIMPDGDMAFTSFVANSNDAECMAAVDIAAKLREYGM